MLTKSIALLLTSLVALVPAPPSGRPPIGPLKRVDPKLHDLTFGVLIATQLQQAVSGEGNAYATRENYNLVDAPIAMPLVYQSTFSRMDPESVTAQLWLDAKPQNPKLTIKENLPFSTALGVMTIGRFTGQSVRWQVGYRLQTWSSVIDDT